jgi:flagellar basal body-associated protein FliL
VNSFTDFFVSFPISSTRVKLGKMQKLDELKDKLSGLKAKLLEKTDKIGFIRAWREKAQKAEATPLVPKAPAPHSLRAIYRDGGVGTRLQVLAFYIFVFVALVSAGSLLKKVFLKMRSSNENEKLQQDFSHEFSEARRKALEKTDLLSLGQFITNAYVGPPKDAMMMSVDLWIRVNDPEASFMIESKNLIFRDKTMSAFNDLFVNKVNLLTDEGKAKAKEKIKEALNSYLKKGEVEEVFIQNMIVQ